MNFYTLSHSINPYLIYKHLDRTQVYTRALSVRTTTTQSSRYLVVGLLYEGQYICVSVLQTVKSKISSQTIQNRDAIILFFRIWAKNATSVYSALQKIFPDLHNVTYFFYITLVKKIGHLWFLYFRCIKAYFPSFNA